MKKSHRPKSGRKGRKPRKKGLGSTKSTSSRAKAIMAGIVDSGKTLVGQAGGFLGGALIAKAIDKVPFLAENATDSATIGYLKKAVKPITILAVGTTVRVIGDHKKIPFVKAIGEGANVSAAFVTAKIIFSKSEIFSGLGSTDETVGAAQVAEYFREQSQALDQVAKENAAQLNLASAEESENVNGFGEAVTIPGTQLNLNNVAMIL